MTVEQLRLNGITEKIIGAAFKVGTVMGPGFLEKVYQNALAYELRKAGLNVQIRYEINVYYDGFHVGEYFADLFVENAVIVELKAVKQFEDVHFIQCLNYLKGTGLKVGLVINFGVPKVAVKRIVNNF